MTRRLASIVGFFLLLTLLESVLPRLIHWRVARADLLLASVVYLAIHDEIIPGSFLSLVAGYLSDLTAAAPSGLYTFLAVLTFIVVRSLGGAFRTESSAQAAAITFAVSVVHSTMAAIFISYIVVGGEGLGWNLAPVAWSALGTALFAPPIFGILRRIDRKFLGTGAELGRGGA